LNHPAEATTRNKKPISISRKKEWGAGMGVRREVQKEEDDETDI